MVRALLFLMMLFDSQQAWTQNPNSAADRINHDSLYWIHVRTDTGVVHAAVAVPKGSGPFPALVILHGTHGFSLEYINIARHLANSGIVE
jgi:hypothetical protein